MVAADVDEGLIAHKGRYGKPAPLFAACCPGGPMSWSGLQHGVTDVIL